MLMTLRRSLAQLQRSRSVCDEPKDLVNVVAFEPMKEFQPNITQTD